MSGTNPAKLTGGTATMPDGSPVSFDGLRDNAFQLIFAKAPFTTLFLQEFTLPGVALPPAQRESMYVNFQEVGNKLDFDPLHIKFLVDKNIKNYIEIFTWMKQCSTSGEGNAKAVTDNVVLVAGNKKLFRFNNCWPMGLGALTFVANTQDITYLAADLTLNYDYWEVV
jgi:hypothetical protein